MMYCNFTAGGKEYKLRINTRDIITLEKHIGCNPLAIFGLDGKRMPTITEMAYVLHASLQPYHHGIDVDAAFDIFDTYLNDGNTPVEFLYTLMEIYKVSGLIRNENKGEENDPNQ